MQLRKLLVPLALALIVIPSTAHAALRRPSPAAPKPPVAETTPAPAGHVHFHHHGPVGFAFVRLAARSLGVEEESLMNEIYQKGLPKALEAHGYTKEKLVDKMVADVTTHAKEHGRSVDGARVKTALSDMYDHLTGAA